MSSIYSLKYAITIICRKLQASLSSTQNYKQKDLQYKANIWTLIILTNPNENTEFTI